MTGRAVLVSSLLSGALWLLLLVPRDEPDQLGPWLLFLTGAIYVGIASVLLAGGPTQVSRWVAAWLLDVALWTWIMSWAPWPEALLVGGFIASLCFAGWQVLALAIRLPLALRAARS